MLKTAEGCLAAEEAVCLFRLFTEEEIPAISWIFIENGKGSIFCAGEDGSGKERLCLRE